MTALNATRHRIDVTPVAPLWATRDMVMVAAAQLCVGRPYRLGGSGPDAYDGFGFIRACVQAAHDWTPGIGFTPGDVLSDIGLAAYRHGRERSTGAPLGPVEPDAHDLDRLLVQWGLEAVQYGRGPRPTLPGDVPLSLGHGPAGAVVITPRLDDQAGHSEWVAMAWAPNGPEIRKDIVLGRDRARIYRWPAHHAEGAVQ